MAVFSAKSVHFVLLPNYVYLLVFGIPDAKFANLLFFGCISR